MISISGNLLNADNIANEYPNNSIEGKTLSILSTSTENYTYSSLDQLKFELAMRKHIIASAIEFYKSYVKFKTFKESTCNTHYWERTEEGGFLLRQNVKPSEGIKDIFENDRKYGTECSTAIIIIYYKALLNIYPEDLFDRTFSNLQLMNWHYIDSDLDVYSQKQEIDFLPGDCRYFKNPDYNKKRPEWQGENALDLSEGQYYGHGIGIKDSHSIIKYLNKHRNKDSDTEAFLTNNVTLPNFKRLASIYLNYRYKIEYPYYRYSHYNSFNSSNL
jgi:protein-glutamine gamma-glutamyltransferase